MNGLSGSADGPRSSFTGRIRSFWQRITEGLELQQLWNQFKTDVQSSYHLYSVDVDRKSIQETVPWRRNLRIAQQLGWAILMKLSPARRVLLLVAIVFLLIPDVSIQGKRVGFQTHQVHVLSGLILLAVLFLEIGHKGECDHKVEEFCHAIFERL